MVAPRSLALAGVALFAAIGLAWGGHEVPIYPSYYPHEIRLETIAPERAAALLGEAKLHAYLGPEPSFAGTPPQSVRAIETLGDFIIVRVNPEHSAADERASCDIVDAVVRSMAGREGFVFHPYPVTPFDGDYLYHADRAAAEKARLLGETAALRTLRVKTVAELAALAHPEWRAEGSEWDAAVEAVDAADLVARSRISLNGSLGPPWVKAGWFHAARLLTDTASQEPAATLVRRLEGGDYRDEVERLNLERDLVAALAAGCRERVAGYTVRRHYFSAEFTNGVENIGFDSVESFQSPIFIRTVKLKDFPWNGWLSLGVDASPSSAWNPIAGFSDRFGQLLWSAIGDPALFSAPYDGGWMLNRIADVKSSAGR
jgi:hypothetical protein